MKTVTGNCVSLQGNVMMGQGGLLAIGEKTASGFLAAIAVTTAQAMSCVTRESTIHSAPFVTCLVQMEKPVLMDLSVVISLTMGSVVASTAPVPIASGGSSAVVRQSRLDCSF